jgi:hypothetical protein
MSRLSAFALTALALLAAACSEPRCPKSYIQDDDYCRRCPEGSAPNDNNLCITDSGGVVDPSDEWDHDAETDDGVERHEGGAVDAGGASAPGDGSLIQPSSVDAATGAASSTGNMDGSSDQDVTASADANAEALDSGVDSALEAGPPCYTDNDKDGVGAGQPVSCEGYGSDAGASLSLTNNDCDDNNDKRSPSLSDVCGDNLDNDCDGTPDDESNNACGGACTTQLAHQPGDKCTNGLLGACEREGNWQCQGTTATVCSAPSASPGAEVCGDSVDNDCDGSVDEADAIDHGIWYQDCDNDGYASTISTSACEQPAPTGSCANWLPTAPGSNTLDCDDRSASNNPGITASALPESPNSSSDLNCDGRTVFDGWVTWPNPSNPFAFNIAYLCPTGLDCNACWTQACTSLVAMGFGCVGAEPMQPLQCSTRMPVRTAPGPGCSWSSSAVQVVETQLECL